MPFPFPILQAMLSLPAIPLIRPELLAGPAIAATAGVAGWLIASRFSARDRAANDNHPPLARPAPRR